MFCTFAVAFFSAFASAFFSTFAVTFFCTFAAAVLSAFAAAFFIVFDGIKIERADIIIGATGVDLLIAAHTGFAAAFSEKSKKRKRHKRENKEFFHVTP